MCKKSRLTLSLAALLCVAFPQVKYIDLSEIVRLVKAVALVRSVNLKLSALFVVSRLFWVCPRRGGSTWFHFKRNISTKHMLANLSVP